MLTKIAEGIWDIDSCLRRNDKVKNAKKKEVY